MFSPARHLAVAAIACAALLAPHLASAGAVHIDTGSLTFDSGWSEHAETLVSDINGAATFSLVSAVERLRYRYWSEYFNDYGGTFQLSARAGYKVTGYKLSGAFYGAISVGQVPDGSGGRPGGANTSSGALLYAQDALTGATFAQHGWSASELQGAGGFNFDSGLLERTGAFNLTFEGYAYGQASPAVWTTVDPITGPRNNYDFSLAQVGLQDPLLLTVYTQAIAVPEPHAFALTLAGLAMLAGATRRRRRPAAAAVYTHVS